MPRLARSWLISVVVSMTVCLWLFLALGHILARSVLDRACQSAPRPKRVTRIGPRTSYSGEPGPNALDNSETGARVQFCTRAAMLRLLFCFLSATTQLNSVMCSLSFEALHDAVACVCGAVQRCFVYMPFALMSSDVNKQTDTQTPPLLWIDGLMMHWSDDTRIGTHSS